MDIGEGKQMLESPSDVETAAYIARVPRDTLDRVFVIITLSEKLQHIRSYTNCTEYFMYVYPLKWLADFLILKFF